MKYLICIPCMDMVHTEFLKSLLQMRKIGECKYTLTCSSLIYDARNTMAKKAITEDYDRVLWLDSDMSFEPDLMERLAARLDEGREMVSGIYFTRKAPVRPVLYEECGFFRDDEGNVKPVAIWYDDYPQNDIFKVQGVGFGGVMMTSDLIKRVADKFGMPFAPMLGFGEDLSFCGRVQEVGGEMWVDSSIKMGHVGLGTITESAYLAQRAKEEKDDADPDSSQDGPADNHDGV